MKQAEREFFGSESVQKKHERNIFIGNSFEAKICVHYGTMSGDWDGFNNGTIVLYGYSGTTRSSNFKASIAKQDKYNTINLKKQQLLSKMF